MKASDRSILLGLVILGLLACFWFVLLSPKREEAADLDQQVKDLQEEVEAQEQLAATAELAEADYAKNYERLIVLGKAAPADGDTPSLLTQLSSQAEKSRVRFGALTLGTDQVAAPPPAAAQTTTDQNAAEGVPTNETPASSVPAPPTEASAATLPIGATVGPAGLGVLPYSLTFSGSFFEIADLLARIDEQVAAKPNASQVDGRLLTVNGFTMTTEEDTPGLAVDLSVTTYVLPSTQGLTAGATPAAPAPTVPAAPTVPTSTQTTP